jgi:hypothetical protein
LPSQSRQNSSGSPSVVRGDRVGALALLHDVLVDLREPIRIGEETPRKYGTSDAVGVDVRARVEPVVAAGRREANRSSWVCPGFESRERTAHSGGGQLLFLRESSS